MKKKVKVKKGQYIEFMGRSSIPVYRDKANGSPYILKNGKKTSISEWEVTRGKVFYDDKGQPYYRQARPISTYPLRESSK